MSAITIGRISLAGLVAAILAFAFSALMPTMASAAATENGKGHANTKHTQTKKVTKFTLKVADRNGNVRSVTVGDSSGRVGHLRRNGMFDCVDIGRGIGGFVATRHPYFAMRAAVATRGCGTWMADSICWTSRQWWGGGARWIVSAITWGHYSRC